MRSVLIVAHHITELEEMALQSGTDIRGKVAASTYSIIVIFVD